MVSFLLPEQFSKSHFFNPSTYGKIYVTALVIRDYFYVLFRTVAYNFPVD